MTAIDTGWPELEGPYLGQMPPGTVPVRFGPGLFGEREHVFHCFPTFAKDGLRVWWMAIPLVAEGGKPAAPPRILTSGLEDGRWTNPSVESFSGRHSDHAPLALDGGKTLLFSSSRPGAPHARCMQLWSVSRTAEGWSDATPLPDPPNTEAGANHATVSEKGTLYFDGRVEGAKWSQGIYFCRRRGGAYDAPVPLFPEVHPEHVSYTPFIAKDESFILLAAVRPECVSEETDLFVCFRKRGGSWAEPVHMDERINDGHSVSFPCVTEDGNYLFFDRFTDEETDAFFWVSASIIEEHRP
jgi:hypothetical protein